jgi:hypothetical protein
MRSISLVLIWISPLLLVSQNIHFAIFSKDTLHILLDRDRLKSVAKSDPEWPVITPIQFYPIQSWTLTKDGLQLITLNVSRRPGEADFDLCRTVLLPKDAKRLAQKDSLFFEKIKRDENLQSYFAWTYLHSNKIETKHLLRVKPLSDWSFLYKHHESLENFNDPKIKDSYQFIHQNPFTDVDFYLDESTQEYHFYLRTARSLMIWKSKYPQLYSYEKSQKNWQIQRFYGLDKRAFLPPPGVALGNPILPNAARFLPQSIVDTAFFRGHNHVVWQRNRCWMVNTSHGAIYYLDKNRVVKVAQIEHFGHYPAAIFGKRFFVENRDKEELLFFNKITHLVPDLPLFKHRCLLDAKELQQVFGNLTTYTAVVPKPLSEIKELGKRVKAGDLESLVELEKQITFFQSQNNHAAVINIVRELTLIGGKELTHLIIDKILMSDYKLSSFDYEESDFLLGFSALCELIIDWRDDPVLVGDFFDDAKDEETIKKRVREWILKNRNFLRIKE